MNKLQLKKLNTIVDKLRKLSLEVRDPETFRELRLASTNLKELSTARKSNQ